MSKKSSFQGVQSNRVFFERDNIARKLELDLKCCRGGWRDGEEVWLTPNGQPFYFWEGEVRTQGGKRLVNHSYVNELIHAICKADPSIGTARLHSLFKKPLGQLKARQGR